MQTSKNENQKTMYFRNEVWNKLSQLIFWTGSLLYHKVGIDDRSATFAAKILLFGKVG